MNPSSSFLAFARIFALSVLLALGLRAHAQTDSLPSWNDGPAKQSGSTRTPPRADLQADPTRSCYNNAIGLAWEPIRITLHIR